MFHNKMYSRFSRFFPLPFLSKVSKVWQHKKREILTKNPENISYAAKHEKYLKVC